MAPDFWLLANGEHRFIEVKLPGDCLRAPQYAGLVLLAAHLPRPAVARTGSDDHVGEDARTAPLDPREAAQHRPQRTDRLRGADGDDTALPGVVLQL